MAIPYPTDPSLPSNLAPLFGDSTAARGDHLRANNAEIWANFTEIVETILGNASLSTDGTFASVVDTLFPSVKAAKTYIDYAMRYDYVIDSQAKFDALVASGTWLGAKNVLFTTNVTRAAPTTIPATVEKIHAINGATLTVTGLTTGQYGFGYATVPTVPKFEVRNFAVNATGTGLIYGFYSCTRLTNCTGTGNGTDTGYGFYSCNQVTNCTGNGINGYGTGYGFYTCTQLTGCSGTGNGTGNGTNGYGFGDCNQVTNCTGTGNGINGYGFGGCNQVTNCTGTGNGTDTGYGYRGCNQVTNCTGTGTSTGNGTGYGFYTCTQLTGCSGTGTGPEYGYGFYDCTRLTNCTGTGTGTGAGYGTGFYSCTQLTNCTGTGTGAGTSIGFRWCTQVTNCTGTGTGTNTGYGFFDCTQVTNCTGTGTGTGNGTGYGFRGCKKCMCNKAGEASTTATYKESYADAGTANACADTAAGGYNS